MPTLGADCQIILSHADINAGAPDGFMLADNTAIATQRSAVQLTGSGTFTEQTKLFATIVCADNVFLPNGARDARSRQQVYNELVAFLSKRSGLNVTTPVGIYAGMMALAHLATESHYPGYTVVVCCFSNTNVAFPPADPALYALSSWVDETTYSGPMNWGDSYWRSS